MRNKVFNILGYIYVLFMSLLTISKCFFQITLISVKFEIIIYVMFYIWSLFFLLAVYTNNRLSNISLIVMPIIYLFIVKEFLWIIPGCLLIPILFSKNTKQIIKIFSSVMFTAKFVELLLFIVLSLLFPYGSKSVLKEIPSPNGQFLLTTIHADQGNLGEDLHIYISKTLWNAVKISKYVDSNKSVVWINDNTYSVDGVNRTVRFFP